MMWKADTLADLAAQINIDPLALEETVNEYNAACEAGEDTAFGKASEFLSAYGDGPFYAVQIMNVAFSTIGGLDVDPQIRVLKEDHETPINGLYAIGNDSGGVLLTPENNYTVFPGIAQGWNQTSGRLAGENAARYIGEAYGFAEVTGVLMEIDSHTPYSPPLQRRWSSPLPLDHRRLLSSVTPRERQPSTVRGAFSILGRFHPPFHNARSKHSNRSCNSCRFVTPSFS